MRPAAWLRRLAARLRRRAAPPPPARDNPYARYFTADLSPGEIARRLRRDADAPPDTPPKKHGPPPGR